MAILIRIAAAVALVWVALLLSGYGVLYRSVENVGGLGLQCRYLTAQGTSSAQHIHSESGIIGTAHCPILRKMNNVIDD